MQAVRELSVLDGPESRVDVNGGGGRPLMLLPRPHSGPDLRAAAADLARVVPSRTVGLVAARTIPANEREALESAGLSWCDGRGALHLAWRGTLIHIDRAGSAGRDMPARTSGLGPAGIRAVQVLLIDAEPAWTVSRLADAAAISIGQAHNVFQTLEQERLIDTTGKGPQQRRRINDRRAALDWLADLDQSRRKPDNAATYLYARTTEDLLTRFAKRADGEGIPYAVTAAAGSHVLGVPVLSRLTVTHIRVGVVGVVDALHRLGLEHLDAEDAGRGANLELWTDTGELGTYQAREINGIHVAPPVRVWLDMLKEGGRSADAAQLFREQILDRT